MNVLTMSPICPICKRGRSSNYHKTRNPKCSVIMREKMADKIEENERAHLERVKREANGVWRTKGV